MEINNTSLDDEELFHLSLKAMENDQTEQAVLHLKQLVEQNPKHGRAYYLLGALHAEIGMYSRAIDEMQRAVELEPDLPTAHFQLGLLRATSGQVAEAKRAWEALDQLDNNDPLFIFKRGLIHLLHDDFSACAEDLNKGIQLNQANPALNDDMRRILQTINQLQNDDLDTDTALSDENTQSAGGRHILLNAYQTNDYDKDVEH